MPVDIAVIERAIREACKGRSITGYDVNTVVNGEDGKVEGISVAISFIEGVQPMA